MGHERALRVTGPRREAHAVWVLVNRLGRHSGTRERRVIARLARLGADAFPHLIKVLRDHPNAWARSVAAASLGRFGSRARRPLLRALRDPAVPVRLKAMLALAGTWTPQVASAVLALAHDPGPGIRNNAIALLARHPTQRAVPVLVRALSDSAWHVRQQAALALVEGGYETAKAREALRRAARDRHPAVRNAARLALRPRAPSG